MRSLLAAQLVDELTLVVFPVTLGTGTRLFDTPTAVSKFSLRRSVPTSTGAIVAHYELAA